MDRLLIDELKRYPIDAIKQAFYSFLGEDNGHALCEIAVDLQGEQVSVNLDSAFDGMATRLCNPTISAAELVFNSSDRYTIYIHRHDTEESFTEFVGMIANDFIPDWLADFQLVRVEGLITIAAGRLLQ